MLETKVELNIPIFNEMMSHSALFTHPNPKQVVVISDEASILQEVLKHQSISLIYHFSTNPQRLLKQNKRIKTYSGNLLNNLKKLPHDSIDIIIYLHPFSETLLPVFFRLLNKDGMMIQQSEIYFDLHIIKKIYQAYSQVGFSDLQLLHFIEPNLPKPLCSAFMAKKHNIFPPIREKDIYNKTFVTTYYNYDMHNAALAIPEFIRKELESI